MRMQALLALLTVSAFAFAGCADDVEPEVHDDHEDDHDDVQPSATQTTTQAATSTTSAASTTTTAQPPANKPPTGSISATVNGTNATFSLAGSDPDGDTVVWDLDFGDGETTSGTELPATVQHMYAVGNFTVQFTITDGKDPVTYDLQVPIVSAGDSDGILFIQGQEFPSNPASSATVPVPDPIGPIFLGAAGCAGFYQGENGQDCVWFELDLAFEGRAFTITSDAGDPDYEFWHACDPTSPVDVYAFEGSTAEGPEAGIIPADAGCVVIWTKAPPDAPTHTFTVL